MAWRVELLHNKRLHADAQTYAAFVGFAALHFTTKASPVRALVSRALCIYTDYVMNYLEQFVDSMRFLEKFDKNQKKQGLNYEDVSRGIERNILDEELQNFLDNNLGNAANGFISNSPGNLANLCHSVSQQFYENWMSQKIGDIAPVAITVGNVRYKGREVYQVSRSSVKRIMAKGFCPDESLDVHVWLTFSNMTVLDLTIIPTLVSKGLASPSDFEDFRYVIWKEGESSSFDYIPVLQHNNFMYVVDKVAGHA